MGFALAIIVALLAALGWVVGFDQALLRLALESPGFALAVVAFFLGVVSLSFERRRASYGAHVGILSVLLGLSAIIIMASSLFRERNWATRYEATLVKTTSAPDSNFLPRRVLPKAVAEQYARSTQNDSRFTYETLHPTISTLGPAGPHRLVWQTASRPNSLVGYWTSGVDHVLEVDADTTSIDVHNYPIHLPTGGEGNFNDFELVIHRSVDPFSEVEPAVYDVANRSAIVPLVRSIWGIQRYHGVAVFDSTGDVTTLSPAEAAAKYPALRLYPETLVRWEADTWSSWRSGIAGHFTKRGRYEVADVGNNPAPILLDDIHRARWVTPLEPMGQSFGLSGLLFTNPATGATTWWQTTGQTVLSPSRALGIAMGDTRIAALKDAQPMEPKLAIRGGQISWLVPIAPSNGSQVQNLVLVNAATREYVVAPTVAQVFAPQARDAAEITGAPGTPLSTADRLRQLRQQLVTVTAQIDSLIATLPAR